MYSKITATTQEFAFTIRKILDRYTKIKCKNCSHELLYKYSKALASDLNAAIHLHYEVYINVFDALYENSMHCLTVSVDEEGFLCYVDNDGQWYWNRLKLNSVMLNRVLDIIDDKVKVHSESILLPVDQFFASLIQHSTNWSISSYTNSGLQVEISDAFVSFTRMIYPDTVMMRSLFAYKYKTGAGSRLLSLITKLADTFCVTITGSSSVYTPYGMPEIEKRETDMTQKQLDNFYRKFGFKVKRGDLQYKPKCR